MEYQHRGRYFLSLWCQPPLARKQQTSVQSNLVVADVFLECDQVFWIGLGITENDIHGGFVDIVSGRIIQCLTHTFGQKSHIGFSFGCAASEHLALIDVTVGCVAICCGVFGLCRVARIDGKVDSFTICCC